MKQYAAIDDVVYFWFAANDTSGSGGDGASPAADVRLAGAASDAIPVYSPTPSLLSHANYPAGAYEIAITASVANGFVADCTYAVFCTLAIDSQNPTGFVGSFDLKPIESNPTQLAGVKQSLTDLKKFADDGYNPITNKIQGITDGVLLSASATSAQLISDNWDEILTGATHNIATSAGRRIREIGAYAIHSGTAQAGNTVHITLDATASANDGVYNRNLLVLTDGTGTNQTRTIIDYNGTTKIATIDREWRISPDMTTEYQIVADDTPLVVDQGVAQAGTESTIKMREYASSIDNTYLCNIVIILAGTGRGQARLVGSYNGTTKVITICGDNWATIPDDTSVYVLIPYGASCIGCIADAALAQINTECDTALIDYAGPTRIEATSDKNTIITEVNTNETKIDTVDANINAILEDTSITLETHLTDIKGTGFTKDIDSLPQCLTAVGFSTHDVDAIQIALEADNGKLYAVYAALLNKMTVTSALMRIYKDDAITLLNELALSDDGITVTRA